MTSNINKLLFASIHKKECKFNLLISCMRKYEEIKNDTLYYNNN